MPTWYEVLGVAPDATGEELRHAYYQAARRLHPDVNLDAGAADDMRRLNRAWKVLGNPEARRAYDRELFTPPPAPAARAAPVAQVEPTYSEVPGPALARLVRPSALIVAVLLVIFVVTAYAGPPANDRSSVPPATAGPQPTSLPVTAADHLGQCLRILPGYDAVVPCSAANDGLVVDVVSASSQCPAGTRAYQLAGLDRIVCLQPGGADRRQFAGPNGSKLVRTRPVRSVPSDTVHFAALRRVRPYVRPYDRQMLVMAGCALAGLGASTVIPLVVKGLVDGPIRNHSHAGIVALAALALLFGVVESGSMWLRRLVLARAALGMETDMRNELYAHLQRLPISFHDGSDSGQLLSRATTDLSTIRRFVGFGLVFLLVNSLTYLLVVALLITLYWPLAVLVGVAALPVLELSRHFERNYMAVSRRLQDQNGDLTTLVEESATGIRVTKAFGRAPLQNRQFAAQAGRLHHTGMQRVRMLGRFWAAIELVPNLTLALVLLGGALAVGRHAMTLGSLVAFVSLVLSLAWPVDALGWIIGTAEEAETAAARIFEVLDVAPAIADRPGAFELARAEGRVRLERVRFAYPGSDQLVLDGIDLELAPGETVALVGATGSGKTSLALLIPRLYDVSGGRVTVDGHDVRDLTLDSLRRQVGVAFEEPVLFSASVRENLLLGWPDAGDEDLAEAIDTAQARFVYDLPWGLDTRVGEQGLTLSGGQRQRLSLARAIVGRPRVLVLDDPLSALDVHTEALVEEALASVLKGVTALVVVHRPSTVALADRVAFLAGGRIVAAGPHGDLMERIPAYRAILSQEAEPSRRTA